LLVVVAVIVIVASLLVPALQTARVSANRAYCANNLHHIGIGYQAFIDSNGNKTSAFIGDVEWINRLLPYVGNNRQVFNCLSQTNEISAGTALGNEPLNQVPPTKLTDRPHEDRRIIVTPNPNGTLSVSIPDDANQLVFISPIQSDEIAADPPAPAAPAVTGSYGVNNAAQYLGAADDQSQKVLAVEYKQLVANVVGASAPDFWPIECAPRHNGMLNVLFADGSVHDMTQYDIDPRVTQIYKTHWLPQVFMD